MTYVYIICTYYIYIYICIKTKRCIKFLLFANGKTPTFQASESGCLMLDVTNRWSHNTFKIHQASSTWNLKKSQETQTTLFDFSVFIQQALISLSFTHLVSFNSEPQKPSVKEKTSLITPTPSIHPLKNPQNHPDQTPTDPTDPPTPNHRHLFGIKFQAETFGCATLGGGGNLVEKMERSGRRDWKTVLGWKKWDEI